MGFYDSSVVKNQPVTQEMDSIPGLGRCPGKVNDNRVQHSCLENSMDRGAWQATVCGVERVRHD